LGEAWLRCPWTSVALVDFPTDEAACMSDEESRRLTLWSDSSAANVRYLFRSLGDDLAFPSVVESEE
jgi:hypothetical protein